jgi:hypothetical protein
MLGPSTTESDQSPKLTKECSLMNSQPIRLLRENSAAAQAELTLPKPEIEEPLFTKVGLFDSVLQKNGQSTELHERSHSQSRK